MTPNLAPSNSAEPDAKDVASQIGQQFELGTLPAGFRRDVLKNLVGNCWGDLPPYSTLKSAKVSEVETATVGTGVVPIFRDPATGLWNAVMLRPGLHYQGPRYAAQDNDPYYMIAGGFINLTDATKAPLHLANSAPAESRAEHPAEGAVREMMEEVVGPDGDPILSPNPDRLGPVDTLTLTFRSGERRVVIGFLLELTPSEVQTMIRHVARVNSDPEYRRSCRAHTINKETGKPEVCRVDIVPLVELAQGQVNLLHRDQLSLFRKAQESLERYCG